MTSDEITQEHILQRVRMRRACYIALTIVSVLWLIKIVGFIFSIDLVQYGIYPRSLYDIDGVFICSTDTWIMVTYFCQ